MIKKKKKMRVVDRSLTIPLDPSLVLTQAHRIFPLSIKIFGSLTLQSCEEVARYTKAWTADGRPFESQSLDSALLCDRTLVGVDAYAK
jgi:hypothetical protein